MRGYFEDEEAERKDGGRDTELTLGTGALVAIPLGLVLVCGLCFGLGYVIGHRAPPRAAAPAAQSVAQTPAPEQEPLQGSDSIPKPSADEQAPVAPTAAASDGTQAPTADNGANPANTQTSSAAAGQAGVPPAAGTPGSAAPAEPQVRPALAGATPAAQPAATPQNVQPALPAGPPLMVQVAAVSHAEDAEVLVNALRKRGYQVVEQREPADGLIHVRIGPFATREEANRMARKLLDDGYNALIQP